MSQASEAGGGGPFDPVFEREPLGGGGAALDVVVATVQGQRGSQEDAHLIHAFKGDEHKVGDSGKTRLLQAHLSSTLRIYIWLLI